MPLIPWLAHIGARIAPFAYGWLVNDVSEWIGDLNPFGNDEDQKAVAGWGLASLLLVGVVIFFASKIYRNFK